MACKVRQKVEEIFAFLQSNWLFERRRMQEQVDSLIRQLERYFAKVMRANLQHVQQIVAADLEYHFSSTSSRLTDSSASIG